MTGALSRQHHHQKACYLQQSMLACRLKALDLVPSELLVSNRHEGSADLNWWHNGDSNVTFGPDSLQTRHGDDLDHLEAGLRYAVHNMEAQSATECTNSGNA